MGRRGSGRDPSLRRGTPPAELFGGLLAMIRLAGAGSSQRRIAERLGVSAAAVSQIEKGQRALKEAKLGGWAKALEVDEAGLLELWRLCQGQVRLGEELVFYSDHPEALSAEPTGPRVEKVLRQQHELRSIYRLTGQIAEVLGRIVPDATLRIEPFDHFHEPNVGDGTPEADKEALEEWAEVADLPCIHCPQDETWMTYQAPGELVRVPILQKPGPIVRRRGKSVGAAELEDLIGDLSAPERERVRGYVDAIIEQRAEPGG